MSYFYKVLLIILGTIFLGLGILGIFIPGLPTTPFLLLTAALYLRSSQRLYQKLISNKILGKYIQNYTEKSIYYVFSQFINRHGRRSRKAFWGKKRA